MKQKILTKVRKDIKKQYPKYSKDKIDEIMYGIECLYLSITKAIIIFIIAAILGVLKELIIVLIMFNIIRLFAFGMHASNSIVCLLFSSCTFITAAYICKTIVIPAKALYIIYPIILLIICIYAPADTVKRPLINKKKRIRFKILSIIVTIVFFIISLIINNTLIINSLTIGLIIECILILPLTYKMFNMTYDNYKNYGLNT